MILSQHWTLKIQSLLSCLANRLQRAAVEYHQRYCNQNLFWWLCQRYLNLNVSFWQMSTVTPCGSFECALFLLMNGKWPLHLEGIFIHTWCLNLWQIWSFWIRAVCCSFTQCSFSVRNLENKKKWRELQLNLTISFSLNVVKWLTVTNNAYVSNVFYVSISLWICTCIFILILCLEVHR